MKLSIIVLITLLWYVEAAENEIQVEEGREKAKYALLIHFFYVVATKLFVLKIIYAALFYVLLSKGWPFVLWFIHYLKKNQHVHHEYIDDHSYHGHYDHDSYDHQPYGYPEHQPHGYGHERYGSNYGGYKKRVYDSDGSYSVKGQ